MQTTDESFLFLLFLRTCETGSLAKAALLLGISRSTATRQLSQLEARIGKKLFSRTASGVQMTPEATELRPRIETLVSGLERLSRVRKTSTQEVSESIRISTPTAIGHNLLIPWIAPFLQSHLTLTIDITHTMGPVRVMPVGCDIRITHSLFSCVRVITRPLGGMYRMMVASPEYLAKNGCPQHPDELVNHSLLGGNDLLNGKPLVVMRGQDRIVVPYLPRLRLYDHVASRSAALAGIGIAVHAFQYDVVDFVRAGKLVQVLPDWNPEPSPVSMLFPAKEIRPIVQELADYIDSRWKANPYLMGVDQGQIQ